METEGSSRCMQELGSSYQKSVEYITHDLPSRLRSILILFSNLRRFPSGVVLQVSPTNPCMYLPYPPVRVIQLILLNLPPNLISGEEPTSCNSSLSDIFQCPVTSPVLGPNTFLSSTFSTTQPTFFP